METLRLEQGILVSPCPTSWALRIRVSMAAIGSLILIADSLPARLDHPRHLAGQHELSQPASSDAEFLVDAARPPSQGAALAQAHRRRVARQPLQLGARGIA